MKKKITLVKISLLTLLFLVLSATGRCYATDIVEFHEPIVVVSSYSVSNDMINPGEDFVLKLVIENMDKKVATSELLLNLSYSDGINIVYPSVSQVYIGSLKGGESKTIEYNLSCSTSYSASLARFVVSINSDNRSTTTSLVAPVKLDTSLIKVLSQDIPEKAVENELVSASILIKSRSADNLSNVVLKVMIDNEETASSTIGNIFAGASKKQTISFYAPKAGNHDLSYQIEYVDVSGIAGVVELYSGQIEIEEAIIAPTEQIVSEAARILSQQEQNRILVCLIGSGLLLVCIIVIVKTKN